MAGDSKLLGTLELSSGDVLKTIQTVNDALKTLGKGVDLDLTNSLKASVEKMMEPLKKQINEVSQAATKIKAPDLSEIKEATKLLQEYYKTRAELFKSQDSRDSDRLSEKQKEIEANLSKYNDTVRAQAEQSAAAQKAQDAYEKTVSAVNDKIASAREKSAERAAKAELAAEQKVVQEAVKLNQEIQRINAQLNNSSTGAATKDALQAQLQAKVTAYNQYTQEVRNAAEQDKEVLRLQEQITLESAKQADALAEAARKEAERKAQQQNDRIGNQIATKLGQFAIRLIREQWNAAVDYAQTYYNKLNEIRTITGKTEEQATRMGDNLRRLAKEMNVTSTELAEAAVTFYRQGLGDEQVEARLEWVTKYAKLAKIEFSSAAELVTAAMNSMAKDIDGDVQRVVDVFLYLGDAAATSGEEIGKAMQKASASATEFGLSFEWLGAYIATVAETTRQAPESIGNAFNSMLARMHQIKQKGFNEEDETKINDVAKALKNLGIELLDSEGQWNKMSDIFEAISKQWSDLDSKQRAYIATTLAGTRQQNVFYALMNDMS